MLVIDFLVLDHFSTTMNKQTFDQYFKTKFVEKTNIIVKVNEVLKKQDFIIFAYQMGFGKTTNMKLISFFLQKQDDPLQDLHDSFSYQLFVNTKLSKQPLSICQDMKVFNKSFGRYYVVYFDFNDLKKYTFEDNFIILVNLTKSFFKQYIEPEDDLSNFESFIDTFVSVCEYLCEMYGTIIIMIDNYDAPFMNLMRSKDSDMSNEDFDDMQKFFINLFSKLKNLNTIKFIFAGITKINDCRDI
jgi:hypothetical protein